MVDMLKPMIVLYFHSRMRIIRVIFKDQILSKVKNANRAFLNHRNHGPSFGNGVIYLWALPDSENYSSCHCTLVAYEKKIRNINEGFSIGDYEVFQILKE